MACQVCTESFTKQMRKKVECPYCQYECCSSCAQRYLEGTPDSANCMNCKRAWTRTMLIKLFNKSFVNNTYRQARENILFELERSMFPDTMPHVEHHMIVIRNSKKIHELRCEKTRFAPYFIRFNTGVATTEEMRLMIPMLTKTHEIDYEIQCLEHEMKTHIQKEPPREFIKKCSRNECNGFLSTAWKCRVCSEYTCKDCHEPLDEGHVCNPDTVKSVEQIKTDSKACPKCSSLIFKIDGCDQMFCTSCHTAFSWRTGRIEIGRVHNPHYYEYQRQRGQANREIGDVQCGGMPDYWHLPPSPPNVTKFHRKVLEFQQYRLPGYMPGEVNAFNLNLKARVEFLTKQSNEYVFKREIYRKDKDIAKKREIGMVATTFVQIMSDLYTRYVHHLNPMSLENEIMNAVSYSNDLFREISTTYDCVVPCIEYPDILYMKI